MKLTSSESARVYNAIPQLKRIGEQVLLGDVWNQPDMNIRDRGLVMQVTFYAGRPTGLGVGKAALDLFGGKK